MKAGVLDYLTPYLKGMKEKEFRLNYSQRELLEGFNRRVIELLYLGKITLAGQVVKEEWE